MPHATTEQDDEMRRWRCAPPLSLADPRRFRGAWAGLTAGQSDGHDPHMGLPCVTDQPPLGGPRLPRQVTCSRAAVR